MVGQEREHTSSLSSNHYWNFPTFPLSLILSHIIFPVLSAFHSQSKSSKCCSKNKLVCKLLIILAKNGEHIPLRHTTIAPKMLHFCLCFCEEQNLELADKQRSSIDGKSKNVILIPGTHRMLVHLSAPCAHIFTHSFKIGQSTYWQVFAR